MKTVDFEDIERTLNEDFISKDKIRDVLMKFHHKFHRSIVTESEARKFIEEELGL